MVTPSSIYLNKSVWEINLLYALVVSFMRVSHGMSWLVRPLIFRVV